MFQAMSLQLIRGKLIRVWMDILYATIPPKDIA